IGATQKVHFVTGATDMNIPDTVEIREVGPRDGFQNEPETIPTERKVELIDRIARTRPAFDEINVFLSASETHNRKNVNRSIAESLAGLEVVLGRAREAGLRCEGVISTSFGCPYEGQVPPGRVLEIAARLRDAGAQEIGFGDTTGMANPRQ